MENNAVVLFLPHFLIYKTGVNSLTFRSGGPGCRAPASFRVRGWSGLASTFRVTAAAGRASVAVRYFLLDQLRFHRLL